MHEVGGGGDDPLSCPSLRFESTGLAMRRPSGSLKTAGLKVNVHPRFREMLADRGTRALR